MTANASAAADDRGSRPKSRSIAYLTLQATREGQAAHAHVHEIVDGLRTLGWTVDLYEPSYASARLPGILGRLAEFRRVQRRLLARLDRYDAVYVRAHFFALTTSRAARRRGVPVVQECNGPYDDLFTAWPAARFARRLLTGWQREQYRDATAVVAVTPELAEWTAREGGRDKATVIPNGANTDLFRPGLEALPTLPADYVIFFGALATWQGIPTLLDATRDAAWPRDVPLVIAGDGALRSEVERAAADDPLVRYVGALSYEHAARAVANSIASLIVKDSPAHVRSGLSPLKLYESMAAGVPVVVSDLPGLADAVTACYCGTVVPAGDSSAVAQAVAALTADHEKARALGASGRSTAVAQHSWRARAEATADTLLAAIDRTALATPEVQARVRL